MSMGRTALAALLFVVSCSLSWAQEFDVPGVPNPLPCDCTDVDARAEFDSIVEYRCWDQFKFGQCKEPFMMQTIKEIPEGYCQITCGRCKCCPTVEKVLRDNGLTEFAWALKYSTYKDDFDKPGWEATVLAPDNGAMKDALAKLGFSREEVERNPTAQDAVNQLVLYHIIPPVPVTLAVWTTPFFLPGTEIPTALKGYKISVEDGEDIKLVSPTNSAKVTKKDLYACKAYVSVLDKALVPFDIKSKAQQLAEYTTKVSATCNPDINAIYDGDVIKKGRDNVKGDAESCCSDCKNREGCNIWVFCGAKDGCGEGKKYGECELKFSKRVADGEGPNAGVRGINVPYVSGYLKKDVKAAGRKL